MAVGKAKNHPCGRAGGNVGVGSAAHSQPGHSHSHCRHPTGIELPALSGAKPDNAPRLALFLSRIHPVKGLHLLVEALRLLRPTGWKFIISGEGGSYTAEVQRLIRTAGLAHLFEFPGALYGERKWQYYRNADLFLLPSLTENFGIVVLEALACETPVLATTGTPWPELLRYGCGWWVESNVAGIARGLDEALASSTATLRRWVLAAGNWWLPATPGIYWRQYDRPVSMGIGAKAMSRVCQRACRCRRVRVPEGQGRSHPRI